MKITLSSTFICGFRQLFQFQKIPISFLNQGPSPEVTSTTPPTDTPASSDSPPETSFGLSLPGPLHGPGPGKGKRGRPRKHAPKLPLPPLYVFIRNLLHNPGYNPSVIAWVEESSGCFKVKQYSSQTPKILENVNIVGERCLRKIVCGMTFL